MLFETEPAGFSDSFCKEFIKKKCLITSAYKAASSLLSWSQLLFHQHCRTGLLPRKTISTANARHLLQLSEGRAQKEGIRVLTESRTRTLVGTSVGVPRGMVLAPVPARPPSCSKNQKRMQAGSIAKPAVLHSCNPSKAGPTENQIDPGDTHPTERTRQIAETEMSDTRENQETTESRARFFLLKDFRKMHHCLGSQATRDGCWPCLLPILLLPFHLQ